MKNKTKARKLAQEQSELDRYLRGQYFKDMATDPERARAIVKAHNESIEAAK